MWAALVAQWVKNLPNALVAGGTGSIPESGGSAGGGYDNPFQYACLENPVDTL